MKFVKNILISLLVFVSQTALSCDYSYIEKMGDLIEEVKEETDGIASKNMPTSIVLAQAVLETGNGTSTAARYKKNHFGLSFNKRILSFDSTIESVFKYFHNLNSKQYYGKLRTKLVKGKSNLGQIVTTLARTYAEDKEYSQKIIHVIDRCQLARFDDE
ncbi:MAG: glucosaminidase domain-containing protein [Candidatus Gracilibacteria bacterium]|nr:glucosaminidase domain-containing protein [Candidatus Gracilibacteria bacterium]